MPTRTCIGCRNTAEARELVRVTRSGAEPVVAGFGGRGAWLHLDPICVRQAGDRRAFSRALRARLADADFADMVIGWLADQGQS